MDSFSERMDRNGDSDLQHQVPHHGLSARAINLSVDHSMVDLDTYSRGRRLFFTPHTHKNRFISTDLNWCIVIETNGLFSLLESTSLCACRTGDLVMFKESKDSLWLFGVLVFAHYLLPGLDLECEYDI